MIKSNPTISYRKDYPRPGLVRSSWLNLDGSWAFLTDDSKLGESLEWQKHFPDAFQTIQVPFSYETAASGVHDETAHSCVWYQRPLTLPENWKSEKKRILLHFEGCDYETTVWINGQKAGTHIGGYTRFSFDITELLKENFSKENILTVCAEDSFDMRQMRGKQRWRNESFACWYVQTTGIWKTVWVEAVPAIYLSYLKLTPHVKEHALSMELEVQAGFRNLLPFRLWQRFPFMECPSKQHPFLLKILAEPAAVPSPQMYFTLEKAASFPAFISGLRKSQTSTT